jgi:hypothetical protein
MSLVSFALRRRSRVAAGLVGLGALFAITALTVPAGMPADAAVQAQSRGGLTAFRSERELRDFLTERRRGRGEAEVSAEMAVPAPPAMAAPVSVSARAASSGDSITNNQTAGVDEGGIVKNYRDMLVVLRRGRLFTVSLAGGGMRPIDSIDAFPPGVSGRGDWYDEMLIAGDRVIVVGYSYARGGTEVNRFRIDPAGRLRFEDAYHLRSNDYYSSRNYASRLIGNKLIYYTPLYLGRGRDPLDALPGLRRWRDDGSERAFRRIADPRRVYIAPRLRSDPESSIDAMHSVVSCDLTARELDCDATAVLGPSSRTFYVSGEAVYLWIADGYRRGRGRGQAGSYIYRLPLDGSRPAAIGARGMPVDQFSFREDAADGRINVLVRANGGGDAMWRPEVTGGSVALLQVPIREFGDGSEEAAPRFYRDLMRPEGASYNFQNRFVGNHLLYGGGALGSGESGAVYAAEVRGQGSWQLPITHAVERIEEIGGDALVVGARGGDLGFSAIELAGRQPRVGDLYVQRGSAQGESRSHAFFYNPDASAGGSGTLGLPVARQVEPAYRRFFGSAAAMLFLRREGRRFSPAGELAADPSGTVDDDCRASCVDWYGNARPIFWRGRVFALLGYELVEGTLRRGRIDEVRRVNFFPRIAARGGGSGGK